MRILIVEDDEKVAGFVAEGFRREGNVTVCAYDGEEGLAFAMDGGFDVAVVDIMMPRLNGIDLIKKLRSSGQFLPIIVLSARNSVDAKIEGLCVGADDYLSKPFSIAELIARVQALTRRAKPMPADPVIKVADLQLDPTTHRVTRAGRRIDLQPLEYQLLEYLMRNQGRIVSKTTIMDRVWDYSFDPHTNVVECRVSHLRSKITAKGEKELIHTARGFGYVLEER